MCRFWRLCHRSPTSLLACVDSAHRRRKRRYGRFGRFRFLRPLLRIPRRISGGAQAFHREHSQTAHVTCLAPTSSFIFLWWELGLVGARPVEQKKGADRAINESGSCVLLEDIPNLHSALRVLSALIAPAILILACSGLVGATSTLLANVIERTRDIAAAMSELGGECRPGDRQDELALLVEDVARATRRSRLLQRALSSLFFAIVMLVLSSVFFGVVAVWLPHSAWAPVLLTLIGVGLLLYACVILALDSWVGVKAVDVEMRLIRGALNAEAKPRRRLPPRKYQLHQGSARNLLPGELARGQLRQANHLSQHGVESRGREAHL